MDVALVATSPRPSLAIATWPVLRILAARAMPTACSSCVATGDETDTRLCSWRAVVARHLAAARRRVGGGRVLRGHDVARAHAEGQARRDRAVERRDPVVAALERPGDADLRALVALAADDERDPAGPVEDPHPLVDRARERDVAVHLDEVGVGQARGRRRGASRSPLVTAIALVRPPLRRRVRPDLPALEVDATARRPPSPPRR